MGGYPQALLKVVNLQGMLDFHRNFHLIKRVKIVVCLWECSKPCMQCYDKNSSKNIRMAAQAIKKSDIVYPSSGTELGSSTTANFCFLTWKMTNILWNVELMQCTYFFHFSSSFYVTGRATAYHSTWYIKQKSQKMKKFANQ